MRIAEIVGPTGKVFAEEIYGFIDEVVDVACQPVSSFELSTWSKAQRTTPTFPPGG